MLTEGSPRGIAEYPRENLLFRRVEGRILEERVCQTGNVAVAFRLPEKVLQIVKPRRIQEAQPRKMTGHTQLLRGCRQQQQSRRPPAQRLHCRVVGAGNFGGPAEVMGLVHHHQIPTRRQGLLQSAIIPTEQPQAGHNQLIIEKWIDLWIRCLDGNAAILVKDVKPQVEPPQEFNKPLMNEGLRHQNQNPRRPAGVDQTMQDEAGLNGLPQTHLIRQQYPRCEPAGHLPGDGELVGNQVNPSTHESADR